ncbi:MAG: SLAP domain-containing protein [Lactobacillus sp.]|jgi:glycerophosphoryl diester phosphodiesterase|nr:SLAP domain-containing protein [Lactobacillus sp.]MCH3905989.1 SLAP domain-containing protein [Lactobacillus sp.]MCH3990437.1 SLAP domain-containing protein [Lactobacillus sp.]MCH4068848.1 SLAP domain-containing protein [Lactobacillus sp.]MCI1304473.1 SLAP domain-containing protein [Lactobacillus sp.]
MHFVKKLFLFSTCCLVFLLNSAFLVVGHRGDPTKFPEETIQSDNSAFAAGADYVELDVHVSRDNVLVVSHDRDLQRVTNSPTIVSQNDFATLHQLTQKNGEHIISLDELFAYYQDKPQAKFVIETKKTKHNNPKNMEDLLAASIKKYKMEKRVMIHSFSAPSLKKMSELLPNVPRIFIVGSLKRINFEVLSYVDAVNVSSDLIKGDPHLISNLHSMGKKVFVWAEMDESPKLWNWLINNNVDGVVTNFPALGYHYKLAKEGSHKYAIDASGTYLCYYSTRLVENPYLRVPKKSTIKQGQQVHVTNAVSDNGMTYYQIGESSFVPAAFVSLNLTAAQVGPYWGSYLTLKGSRAIFGQSEPETHLEQGQKLLPGKRYRVLGFNGSVNHLWLLTSKGWVDGKQVLLTSPHDYSPVAAWYYHQLPASQRQLNLNLLTYNPLPVQINVTYKDQLAVACNLKAASLRL